MRQSEDARGIVGAGGALPPCWAATGPSGVFFYTNVRFRTGVSRTPEGIQGPPKTRPAPSGVRPTPSVKTNPSSVLPDNWVRGWWGRSAEKDCGGTAEGTDMRKRATRWGCAPCLDGSRTGATRPALSSVDAGS